MGADAFVAIYGVKFEMTDADSVATFDPPWKPLIRREKLRWWSGRLTDRSPYYVVVGEMVGLFGVDGRDSQLAVSDAELAALSASTRQKLKSAGIPGEPVLHLLFEAQY